MPESKEQTRAQQLVGDFAPKLAQLTDDVLDKLGVARADSAPGPGGTAAPAPASPAQSTAKVIYDGPVRAPVTQGQAIGTLKIWRGDILTIEVPG